MQNVVRFPEARSKPAEDLHQARDRSDTDVMARACKQFQEAARREIHRSLLLLDLAAQRARLFVKKIEDPADRSRAETKIERLETQIQTARDLAARI